MVRTRPDERPDRRVVDAADQVDEEAQRRLVGPMRIVDHQ
jgi:hypothetical protein